MKFNLLIMGIVAFTMGLSPVYASGQKGATDAKPGVLEAVVTTLEATVEAVDYENRKVTLKGPEGKTVTIEVGEQVKNLPQVEVGDLVKMEYVEAVTIQVFAPGEIAPGTTIVSTLASAEPGQKPAGVTMDKIIIVATIEAIDVEEQLVTLRGAEGKVKTVKAENPENLKKVQVGDKVMITYTEAIAISVNEQAQ